MIQGSILDIRSDAGRRIAVVEVAGRSACPRCEKGKGCGAGLFGASGKPNLLEVPLANDHELSRGQRVTIEMQHGSVLRAAIIVYGWPLTGALLGAAAGLLVSDVLAAVVALAGIAAGWFLARRHLLKPRCLQQLRPVISG